MKTVALTITNLFELAGALFLLVLATSVLLGFDVLSPVLNYINAEPLITVGLALTYILYKSEVEDWT
ncbi:uncharacterized protein METZ01_LOCUS406069 [marine metagenome]|uniref:Uncharacterized protein n=1 Tax=marine metagenome TaxID=408172 RepID=A0A382W4L1_9ZZZZ